MGHFEFWYLYVIVGLNSGENFQTFYRKLSISTRKLVDAYLQR